MSGHLLHNLILFGRVLRGLGLDVNSGSMIDLVRTLEHVDITCKLDFYHAARSLLVQSYVDIALFDKAFDLFWRKHEYGAQLDIETLLKSHGYSQPTTIAPLLHPKLFDGKKHNQTVEEDSSMVKPTRTYNARETLRQKDFSDLSNAELQSIQSMMRSLAWQLAQRRTRRHKPGTGPLIDMRRTLRNNLRYGGNLLDWAQRKSKYKPRPLIIIADISGSMERYTRLLLHFTYTLVVSLDQKVETFLFGTRLTRITRHMKGRDIEQALQRVSQVVQDWSGGTQIGEALKAFNFCWTRRVMGHRAVVLLMSDGWDRGVPDLLHTEIARLQRNCFRLIWLNPLLGSPAYEPLTRGMQTALPYIDDFLPVHNLASLEDLVIHLNRIEEGRPLRKQYTIIKAPTT